MYKGNPCYQKRKVVGRDGRRVFRWMRRRAVPHRIPVKPGVYTSPLPVSPEKPFTLLGVGGAVEVTEIVTFDVNGVEYRRVRAVRDIPHVGVHAGDAGGWGASGATVEEDAWVGGDAMVGAGAVVRGKAVVEGKSVVRDGCVVEGHALVSGKSKLVSTVRLSDNVVVVDSLLGDHITAKDNTHILQASMVYGYVTLSDNAMLGTGAHVTWGAKISGNAYITGKVEGNCTITDYAGVLDDAIVEGNVTVSGTSTIQNQAHVTGQSHVTGNSTVLGDAHVSDFAYLNDAHIEGVVSEHAHVEQSTALPESLITGHARVTHKAVIRPGETVTGTRHVEGPHPQPVTPARERHTHVL